MLIRPDILPQIPYKVPDEDRGEVKIPPAASIGIRYFLDGSDRYRKSVDKSKYLVERPQAFLVEFPSGGYNAAHFHPVDQFQVFFPSEGAWYQRTPIAETLLHYTDAYTTYGPFGADGHQGMRFLTLRAMRTSTTGFMPKDRDKLVKRGKRNYHVPVSTELETVAINDDVQRRDVINPEVDGLAAYVLLVKPGARMQRLKMPEASIGQYWCILQGSLVAHGVSYEALSLGWFAPGVVDSNYVANDLTGCTLLVVQFPAPTNLDPPELEGNVRPAL